MSITMGHMMLVSMGIVLVLCFYTNQTYGLKFYPDGIVGYVFPLKEITTSEVLNPCGQSIEPCIINTKTVPPFSCTTYSIPKSSPLCGTQATSSISVVGPAENWHFPRSDVELTPSQMITNARDLNSENIAPDGVWQDSGIAFYMIDLLRDKQMNVIYKDKASKSETAPCEEAYKVITTPGQCTGFYINKKYDEKFEPVLASDHFPGGFSMSGSISDLIRPLHDYIIGSESFIVDKPQIHLYTTIPFNKGDPLMHNYADNGIVGGIFVGALKQKGQTINNIESSYTEKSSNIPEMTPSSEFFTHPVGTVPLVRYHGCFDPNQEGKTGFAGFFYKVEERSDVVFPLFDKRHLNEIDPGSSDPRATNFNRESQCQFETIKNNSTQEEEPPICLPFICSSYSPASISKSLTGMASQNSSFGISNSSTKYGNKTTTSSESIAELVGTEFFRGNTTINSVPNAQNIKANTTDTDGSVSIIFEATDADKDDDLSAIIVSTPSNGKLSEIDQETGTVVYTPDQGFGGTDTFTYKVSDGKAESNTATVTIKVEEKLIDDNNMETVINRPSDSFASFDSDTTTVENESSETDTSTPDNEDASIETPRTFSQGLSNESSDMGCENLEITMCEPSISVTPSSEKDIGLMNCDNMINCSNIEFESNNDSEGESRDNIDGVEILQNNNDLQIENNQTMNSDNLAIDE